MFNRFLKNNSLSVSLCIFSGLSIITLFLYFVNLDNYFLSDDWFFLFKATSAKGIVDIFKVAFDWKSGWFLRPMQFLFTWVLCEIFGINTFYFHLTILFIHIFNSFLISFITFKLYKHQYISKRYRIIISSFVGFLFFGNFHHNEALFWYSAFNEPLCALFQFSALFFVLLILNNSTKLFKKKVLYFNVFFLFSMALLTKESSIVFFPLVFITILLIHHSKKRKYRISYLMNYVRILYPIFLILIGWIIIYLLSSNNLLLDTAKKTNSDIERGLIYRYTSGFVSYLFKSFSLDQSYISNIGFSNIIFIIIAFIVVTFIVIAFIRKRYIIIWSIVWISLIIFPYVVYNPYPEDRFLYIIIAPASICIIELIAWCFSEISLVRNIQSFREPVLLTLIICTVLMAFNLIILYKIQADWRVASKKVRSILSYFERDPYFFPKNALICLDDIPDSYIGKYFIFRNAISEAILLVTKRNDLRIRANVLPPTEHHIRNILNREGCDFVFIFNDHLNELIIEK